MPPVGIDAKGQAVNTSAKLIGDETVEISVNEADGDVSYPLLVSGSWGSEYDWLGAPETGFEGWNASEFNGEGFYSIGYERGMSLAPLGGRVVPRQVFETFFWVFVLVLIACRGRG